MLLHVSVSMETTNLCWLTHVWNSSISWQAIAMGRYRQATESKSSGDSNFIEILIPRDCYAGETLRTLNEFAPIYWTLQFERMPFRGDSFVVEVDNAEFQMVSWLRHQSLARGKMLCHKFSQMAKVVPAGCRPGEVIYMDMRDVRRPKTWRVRVQNIANRIVWMRPWN